MTQPCILLGLCQGIPWDLYKFYHRVFCSCLFRLLDEITVRSNQEWFLVRNHSCCLSCFQFSSKDPKSGLKCLLVDGQKLALTSPNIQTQGNVCQPWQRFFPSRNLRLIMQLFRLFGKNLVFFSFVVHEIWGDYKSAEGEKIWQRKFAVFHAKRKKSVCEKKIWKFFWRLATLFVSFFFVW